MEEDLTYQISTVRKLISEVFSSPTSPSSILSPIRSPRSPKIGKHLPLSHFPKFKPKEFLSLPSISVHRNPISIVSERDILHFKSRNKKKHTFRGGRAYNLTTTNSYNDINWDKVIVTCGDLIKKHS